MGYANGCDIPFVAIVGETEIAQNKLTIKNMATGEQQLLTIDDAIEYLNNN
jgi:histidyl-tRNA synthetase